MSISQIASSVSESVTLALNEKAAVLRAKGEPLIHLGGGEPKARAPVDSILAAAAMLSSGEIRYTPSAGTPAMKAAIIRYTQEYYGRKVTPNHVIASSGAKQAIMVALRAILDPLDEVVFPAPYWVSYPEMVRLCGAVPVPATPEDGTLVPTAEDIISRVGSQTKAILINSPSNPSGLMIPPDVIRDVVEFCEKEGIYLITDDIYHRLLFDGKKWTNPYEFSKDLGDTSKLIVINGVSKAYAMTGFRIGWAVANPKLIEVMGNIQSHETSGPAGLLQVGAVAAINGIQSSVENLRMQLENRKNILMSKLGAFEGVKVTEPDGNRPRHWVRSGRPPPYQLLRAGKRRHRGCRAHQVGAGSQLTQRAPDRQPQTGAGLGLKGGLTCRRSRKSSRPQKPKPGSSRAGSAWKTTGSST